MCFIYNNYTYNKQMHVNNNINRCMCICYYINVHHCLIQQTVCECVFGYSELWLGHSIRIVSRYNETYSDGDDIESSPSTKTPPMRHSQNLHNKFSLLCADLGQFRIPGRGMPIC